MQSLSTPIGIRFSPVIAICVSAMLSCPFVARGDDWQTGVGGDAARSGLSDEIGPESPAVLWQGSRSAIVSQQGVIDGDLFVVSRIANFTIPTGTWIVAHDLFTGEERWAIQLPFNDPDEWRSRVMAIRDGQVYASRTGGEVNPAALYALDPADGSIIWESEDLIEERTTESPSFAPNGDLIIGNFSSVTRIDHENGETVWTTARSCPTSNGCSCVVANGRVYLWEAGAQGPVVTAFHLTTGARLYSTPGIGGGFIQQLGLMVGPDGTVYAPRTQNNPATDFLVALRDTGLGFVERWRVPLGYIPFGSLAVGPDGSVYSYVTGDTAEAGANVIIPLGAPQRANGPEAIEAGGQLTVVRLDPSTGATIDSSPSIPTNFPAAPRIAIDADGKVFVTNGGFSLGAVYSFNADLSVRWSHSIPNVNLGGPAIGEDGVTVVCGVGTNVIAYQSGVSGDFDADRDRDLRDFADMQICIANALLPRPIDCMIGDLDENEVLDLIDHAIFADRLSGPAE